MFHNVADIQFICYFRYQQFSDIVNSFSSRFFLLVSASLIDRRHFFFRFRRTIDCRKAFADVIYFESIENRIVLWHYEFGAMERDTFLRHEQWPNGSLSNIIIITATDWNAKGMSKRNWRMYSTHNLYKWCHKKELECVIDRHRHSSHSRRVRGSWKYACKSISVCLVDYLVSLIGCDISCTQYIDILLSIVIAGSCSKGTKMI